MSLSNAQVVAKEVLFVYPPDGWRLSLETKINDFQFFEYLPFEETPQQWTEMVTVQILDNLKGLNPTTLASNLRTQFITGCERQTIRGPEQFNMRGYLAVRLYVECDEPSFKKQPANGDVSKHKVAAFQIIQGRRKLYMIERAWRGRSRAAPNAPYGRDDLWGWDAFLHKIEVCDSEELARACFGLGLLSPEKAAPFVAQVDPVLPYGCDYFRILTLLPDTTQATRRPLVVPLKLGLVPFGSSIPKGQLIGNVVAAYEDNRPVAVIVTVAGSAMSGIFSADAAKAARDTNAMVSLLVARGVAPNRINQTLNADCPG